MPWYYIVKAPLLLSIRVYLYFRQKFQYFLLGASAPCTTTINKLINIIALLDFCYWANLLLWIYLVFLPSNKQLFTVVYAVAHGPLAWAVMLFNNSLVFHSLDKTTSAFIHISPVLVTYCIRWFGDEFPENENYGVCDPDDSDCASFTWTAVVPAVFYVIWIVVYGILIRFVFPVPNPDYLTSYRWLTRPKSGPVRFLADQKLGWVIYAIGNIVIAFLMLCPVILCYRYQIVNLIFGILVVLVAIWNGAGYYINVFSKKYSASIESELNKVTSPVC